jgi:hypothetical protein
LLLLLLLMVGLQTLNPQLLLLLLVLMLLLVVTVRVRPTLWPVSNTTVDTRARLLQCCFGRLLIHTLYRLQQRRFKLQPLVLAALAAL